MARRQFLQSLVYVGFVLSLGAWGSGPYAQIFSSDTPALARAWFNKEVIKTSFLEWSSCPFDSADPCQQWGKKDREAWEAIRPNVRDILIQTMYLERNTKPLTLAIPQGCPGFSYLLFGDSSVRAAARQRFQSVPFPWTTMEIRNYNSLPDWFRKKVEFAYWKEDQRSAWGLWQQSYGDCASGKYVVGDAFSSAQTPEQFAREKERVKKIDTPIRPDPIGNGIVGGAVGGGLTGAIEGAAAAATNAAAGAARGAVTGSAIEAAKGARAGGGGSHGGGGSSSGVGGGGASSGGGGHPEPVDVKH